jgi:acyl dehydratase
MDAELPVLELGPLEPELFVRYAEASGDHNPLHTDPAFARAAGLDGVIAHGMLVMGVMGRVAAAVAGPGAVAEFQARFVAQTTPGELLRCGGRVVAVEERGGRPTAVLELWARGAGDQLKAAGSAAVDLGGGAPA